MKKKYKILLVLAGLLGVFALLPSSFTDQLGNMFSSSGPADTVTDTTSTVNTIDANYKNKLRAHLLDSLKNKLTPERLIVFKEANKDSLFEEAKEYWAGKIASDTNLAKETSELSDYVYTSKIDTTIKVKDSSGVVTDKIEISSTVASPIPIHPLTIHSLSLKHTRFDFEDEVKPVEFSLSDNIKIGTVVGYGFGLQSKVFDTFVGVGALYSFNLTTIF